MPELYRKSIDWIGADAKTFFEYGTSAKDFVHEVLFETEIKEKKWFGLHKELQKSRISRLIAVELDPENSNQKHKAYKKSSETLAYVFVLLPDDGKQSQDILHYSNLPDNEYPKRKIFFLNKEILKRGFGFASKKFASKYYDELKEAEVYAVKNHAIGKSAPYDSIRRRTGRQLLTDGKSAEIEAVQDGVTIKLTNGYTVRIVSIVAPTNTHDGFSKYFTAPYGNLMQISTQTAKKGLIRLLSDQKNQFNAIRIYQSQNEIKRNGKRDDHIYATVLVQDEDSTLKDINLYRQEGKEGEPRPAWASRSAASWKLLSVRMIMEGNAFPWMSNKRYSLENYYLEAHDEAIRNQKGLMHSDFEALNYIPPIKNQKVVNKGIGTPIRRMGSEDHSWQGLSNFNG